MNPFKKFMAPKVRVDGNRFTITPIEGEIVEPRQESSNLPQVRPTLTVDRPAPMVGTIPRHSWGG